MRSCSIASVMAHLAAIKVRLYPNTEQREQLDRAFGCCRFLWNQMLDEHQHARARFKIDGIASKYKTEKECIRILRDERNIRVMTNDDTAGTAEIHAFGDPVRPRSLVARIDEERIHGL